MKQAGESTDSERFRRLLERVRLYAIMDLLQATGAEPQRMLGLERDIDDALAGRPERKESDG